MKLVSYENGTTGYGPVLSDGSILDLRAYWGAVTDTAGVAAPGSVAEMLHGGPELASLVRDVIAAAEQAHGGSVPTYQPEALRFAPPITPGRIYAIGLNYRNHAEEQGAKIPKAPVVFTKAISSLTGHGAPIMLPDATESLDYEAELAAVIGRRCANVAAADAMSHIAGYTCLNDVTARDIQRADRQWFRSKSYPTFCPLGRDLVTADEVTDLDNIVVSCQVGDDQRQSAPISDLIFGIPQLIEFLSSFTTLEVGDVIATGTPGGVGFAMDPPRYLAPGDLVTVSASGITTLANDVTAK